MNKPRYVLATTSDRERNYLGKWIEGRAEPTFARAEVAYAVDAAQACADCNVLEPMAEIPDLFEFAEMARRYHDAAATHLNAKGKWEQFTASHASDDPAHDWHSQQVTYTRNVLNAADVEYRRAFDAMNASKSAIKASLAKAA